MAYIHEVIDTDAHFKIDGQSRVVTNVDEIKKLLVQYDYNSERITFEIPRYVDRYDLLGCNVVQVHYINSDLTDKNSAASKTIERLTEQIKDLETKNALAYATIDTLKNGGHSSDSGSGSGSGSGGGGSYSDEDAAWGIAQNIWTYGSWNDDPVRRQRIIDTYGEGVANRAQEIVNEYVYSGRADELINLDSDVWGYDTGGYTGSWNDSTGFYKNGKMALLHQKELVLNETDTQNLLNAVNIIRAMTDGLKSNALNSIMSNFGTFNDSNIKGNQDLEQNIHIDANFPNVKNASEIEQAILSLADQATQYVHKIR